MIIGVDYGSRFSGNTVAAVLERGQIPSLYKAGKKQDADKFLQELLGGYNRAIVAIDAPLSLPGVYRSMAGCSDFFYRECDRQLGAMSPMFLGGLTARAMQLKQRMGRNGLNFYEVYPAALVRRMQLQGAGYKKEARHIPAFVALLNNAAPYSMSSVDVPTWHHVDALLALWAGICIDQGKAMTSGNDSEGLIYY